jgi:hypothetical protein
MTAEGNINRILAKRTDYSSPKKEGSSPNLLFGKQRFRQISLSRLALALDT